MPLRMKAHGFDESQVTHWQNHIRSNGLTRHVQVEELNNGSLLTDGHHYLEAARREGVAQVPTRTYANTPEGHLAALKALNAAERAKQG